VKRVPADPAAILDVVPVDHVADVILSALYDDAAPDTLHAVAGELAPTAGEFTALAATIMGVPAPELNPAAEDVPPGGLEVYAPYFTVRTRFNASRARALGLEPPPVGDYLERILEFAERARWGKRPLPLSRAAA
jgi:nucleoside-diphosphate-sugar epimerase